jgi:hypothetical protein
MSARRDPASYTACSLARPACVRLLSECPKIATAQARNLAGMDGQPPDEKDSVVARSGNARPLPSGTSTDQLIATIVELLARQVASDIIDASRERP